MKKEWKNPKLGKLSIDLTNENDGEYVYWCNWNGVETLGVGNEEYTDPNKKPADHPDWVWCKVHGRWHPKDHGSVSGS